MKSKTTGDLIAALQRAKDLHSFICENNDAFFTGTLAQCLQQLLEQKNLKKSQVLNRAQINDIYGYQIFQGIKTPSRDKLLSLCLGFSLSIAEAQALLKHAGAAPLYPRNLRDAAILFAIKETLDVPAANDLLYELELETLN